METDSFRNAKLAHLNFESDTTQVSSIALPDELPKKTDFSQLPREILKSSTVENLISQNEDLMARLKVALRRLSILETENQKLNEESSKTRLSQSSFTDQILILKEKDAIWKQKIDQLEREKEIQSEKIIAFNQRVTKITLELNRYVKYHDRIKNQVKPYIAQLKEFANNQEMKAQNCERELSQKEALIRDLRFQIVEVTKNSRLQVETTEKKTHELVLFYEEQLEALQRQVRELQSSQEDLEVKSLKLHAALERQDELENEVITLQRSKEDIKERLESELTRQQERISELTRQNQKLGMEHADLQISAVADQGNIKKLEKECFELKEQLESLRFMWTAKNEELEKVKMAASAMERLNLELSQKLNDARKS